MSRWKVEEAQYSDTRVESCLRDENHGGAEWRKDTIRQRQQEAENERAKSPNWKHQ